MLVLVNKRTFPEPVRYYRDFGREKRIWRREDVEEFFSSYQGEPEDKEKDKLTLAGEKALIIFFLTGRPDRYGQNLVSSINPASMYYQ